MKSLLSIMFIMLLYPSCAQTNQNKADRKEDFDIFLFDFSNSPDFQKKRISNIFIECEISVEGDSSCKQLDIKNWSFVKLIKTNYLNHIYDNFNLNTNDTDERVFSIERIEGGSSVYYYFKRQSGQWYLVKRVIYL